MALLNNFGIQPKKVHHNLSQDQYRDEVIGRGEGKLSSNGTAVVTTGIFTGRSPNDRFFVLNSDSEQKIDWGEINKPLPSDSFNTLLYLVKDEMNNQELFVFDGFAGADSRFRLPIRVVTMKAWQSHFSNNMFIRPSKDELSSFTPEFTVLNASSAKAANWAQLSLNSEIFIVVNIEKKLVIIGGTEYGGEIKKSIFSVLNYLLPNEGVLPMHCSANIGSNDDTALFFGLSGTGKTTLSTDSTRRLIGDDEHGWSDQGVFNFEGGCYAKTINLDPAIEPEIYNAIRPGALLENVVMDEDGNIDYSDSSITENTRVSYPIDYIDNIEPSECGGHPLNVFFLTADAFGVLPPISQLTPEMAMYHFLSGYTAIVAGTVRGIVTPTVTFSACFGAPFMPQHPTVYARMLGEKIAKHNAKVWLINTGWTGGPYGEGTRIDLPLTRRMLNAILLGELDNADFIPDSIFQVLVPTSIEGVPDKILQPRNTWEDGTAYDIKAQELATLFVNNFEKYRDYGDFESAGPLL